MAKLEYELKENFNEFVESLEEYILNNDSSSEMHDNSDIVLGEVKCAVRVFERHSIVGGWTSLNVTILGKEDNIIISAITSGGNRAGIYYEDTVAEKKFLKIFEIFINIYKNEAD